MLKIADYNCSWTATEFEYLFLIINTLLDWMWFNQEQMKYGR